MKILAILILLLAPAAFAQPISIGIRGGVPFTGAFSDQTFPSGSEVFRQYSNSNEYVVGPMVEFHLPFGFAVEADALYHPLELTQQFNSGASATSASTTFNSWDFPILVKYHILPLPLIKPYVEAGPSFRATAGALSNYFSKAGFAIGAGVEVKVGRLRLEPELRYIRWGSDATVTNGSTTATNLAASNVNQAQFVVGIAF